ncbi:MAG: cysteine-rich CWC family protein [Bacteroidota bacterium]
MIKICPHCNLPFECRENDILNCECLKVNLSRKVRERIAQEYNACLCVKCLKEFSGMVQSE